ncbi:Gamma-carboxymuconolactone decarboxylase subunit-like protein [Lactobacillus equicursoris DSM 19284 = JCM 14600 = CIP 110162]|uniref:Gamma-carboxymuconolactone decarboxylase subunit-like protein n=1 Tax=Lactobacillus equicursoris DSM 19284 = JCM 14600 = CIP 110162 TaxID=1293597 RepID=K0NJ67_9LACO|nr:carboxymuconolactone decarboxylase family protein [Lactobacillus equicursoris]KRL00703.1 gamma-carboxymuconolactone decarboxylase subunit-like protein [Lactobacillus equicursoris DSM 19284 = JCM 14600 = CIP 110162]CCK85262.1 Gamma-carboxymuconolactone decarboxylase subunit-like protein [Lactobacillus equicursoris DSM 19284 = JCM 14600 = CIP 110162]
MVKQTAGRDQLGEFAPKFAELNDDVLFGEVWSREGQLPLKTRSIVTITALISKGITDSSLKYHLMTAKKNGVSKSEMAEILTHLAFYAGWPNAWAAFNMAKEIYGDDETSGHGGFFGMGEPNDGFAQYFTGNSYLNPVTKEDDPLQIHNVTFEPGCINHWHIHHASKGGGQVLIGVEGEGWCQIEGQDPIKILPGTIVEVPAGAKHWHGASKNSWFSHLAFMIPGEDLSNEWLEPVDEDFYNALD